MDFSIIRFEGAASCRQTARISACNGNGRRSSLALTIIIAMGLLYGPTPYAQQEEGASSEVAPEQHHQALMKERKKTLLVKRKWHKKDYTIIGDRRESNGLPRILTGTGIEIKGKDKFLFTNGSYNFNEAKFLDDEYQNGVWEERIASLMAPLKRIDPQLEALPDISVVLSLVDDMAAASRTGQILIGAQISKMQNWDQVDFVIAHELAHILDLHYKAQESRTKAIGLLSTGVQLLTGGNNNNKRSTESVAFDLLAGLVVAPAFGRRDEAKADKLALDMLAWNNLAIAEASALFNLMAAEKQEDLERCIAEADGEEQLPEDCKSTDSKNIIESLTRTHSSDQKRAENLKKYQQKYYAGYEAPKPRQFSEADKKSFFGENSTFARTSRAYRAIKIMEGQYPGASFQEGVRLARSSYDEDDKLTNEPRIAMYLVDKYEGREAEGIEKLLPLVENETAGDRAFNILIQYESNKLRTIQSKILNLVRIVEPDPLTEIANEAKKGGLFGLIGGGQKEKKTEKKRGLLGILGAKPKEETPVPDLKTAQEDVAADAEDTPKPIYEPATHLSLMEEFEAVSPTLMDVVISASIANEHKVDFHIEAIRLSALLGDEAGVAEGLEACADAFPGGREALTMPSEEELGATERRKKKEATQKKARIERLNSDKNIHAFLVPELVGSRGAGYLQNIGLEPDAMNYYRCTIAADIEPLRSVYDRLNKNATAELDQVENVEVDETP